MSRLVQRRQRKRRTSGVMATADPDQTQTADPDQTQPAYPNQTQPADPNQTQPADPDQTQPADPDQTQPADPDETQTADPDETQTADPDETQTADLDQTQTTTLDQTLKTTIGRSQIRTYTLYGFNKSFDWKSTHFLKPLPPNRQCNYCGLVPSSIAVLPCCHLVCSSCYFQFQNKHVCVLDGQAFVDHDVGWAFYTIEDLAMQDILCWNVDNGCDTSGPSLEVLDHFNGSCWCHPVICRNCYRVVKNGDTLAHLSLGCVPGTAIGSFGSHEGMPAKSALQETRETQTQVSEDSLESEHPSHRQQSGSIRPSHNTSTSSQTGAIPKRPRDSVSFPPILGPSTSAAGLWHEFRTEPEQVLVGDRPQPTATLWDQSENVGRYPDQGIADYIKPESQAQLSKYTETLRQIDVAFGSIDAVMVQSLQHVAGHDGTSSSTMHGGGVTTPDVSRENVHGVQTTDPAVVGTAPPQHSADVGVASAPARESASDLEVESHAAPGADDSELATPLDDPALTKNPVVNTEDSEIEDVVEKASISAIVTPAADSADKPLTADIKPDGSDGEVKEHHAPNLDPPKVGGADGAEGTGGVPAGPSQPCLSLLRAQQDAIGQSLRIIVAGMEDVKDYLRKIVTEDLPLNTASCKELRARMREHAAAWSELRKELKDEMQDMAVALVQGSGARTIRAEDAEVTAPDRLTQKIDLLLHGAKYFLQQVIRKSHPVDWSVDNWSALRAKSVAEGTAVYHHYIPLVCVFYGYSIAPGIKIDSTKGLPRVYLSFCLHKGDYDDFVDWPMQKELVLSIRHPTERGKVRTLVVDTRQGNVKNYDKPDEDDGRGPFFSVKGITTEYFADQGYIAGDKLLFKFEVKNTSS